MNRCWFMNGPIVHILLGPHGDLIQMLPAWMEIYRATGRKAFVVVSEEYTETLDGVSYVDVFPFQGDWKKDTPKAREYAMSRWCSCRVLQWWNDTAQVPLEFRGTTPLNCRGKTFSINTSKWPSYGHSMYERAGFPAERDWIDLPLVFDRRNRGREETLLNCVLPSANRRKPLLLYNFTGVSSPFGWLPELWPILQRFSRDFTMLDLGKIRAERIYDLLGLYDVASGLLTCDTATLHLAAASVIPYVAWTQNKWCGSVSKGNCVLRIPYAETLRRLSDVHKVLENWKREHATSRPVLVSQGR